MRAELRELVNCENLEAEIQKRLADGCESEGPTRRLPVFVHIRLSRLDVEEAQDSPERQQSNIAEYCAKYGFRPVELCLEFESAYGLGKERKVDGEPTRLRKDWWRAYEDIQTGRLSVAAVLVWHDDRFTRDQEYGLKWLNMLSGRGIGMHDTHNLRAPQPLSDYDEFSRHSENYARAQAESNAKSRRQIDKQRRKIENQEPLTGNAGYGHRAVKGLTKSSRRRKRGTVGFKKVPEEVKIILEAVDLLRLFGNAHAVCVELNSRGERTRTGHKWRPPYLNDVLKAARMIGKQECEGALHAVETIEPILDEPTFREVHELLPEPVREEPGGEIEKKPRGPSAEYPLSGFGRCAICGDRLVGTMSRGERHYRCSKRSQAFERRCECGRTDGKCRCSALKTWHPCPRAETFERFAFEAVLACVDLERVTAEAAVAARAMSESSDRRTLLEEELAALAAKQERASEAYVEGELSKARWETQKRECRARASKIEQELAELDQVAKRGELAVALTDTDVRAHLDENPWLARRMVEQYIDRFEISVTQKNHVEDAIKIVWRDDVAAPADEVTQALREQLFEARMAERARRRGEIGRTRPEVEAMCWELWQDDHTIADICAELDARRVATPYGGAAWSRNTVAAIIKRQCENHGVAYQSRRGKPVRMRYTEEERAVIYELMKTRCSFLEIVDTLADCGISTWDDDEWTPLRLQRIYASECSRRGARPVGRKRQADPALDRRVAATLATGLTYQQVADKLNKDGVRRWNGTRWSRSAVNDAVRRHRTRAGRS